MRTIVALVTLLVIGVQRPFAAEWTGDGDGMFWNDDDNWSPAMTPGGGDNVKIEMADVVLNQPATINSIAVTSGSLEVNDPLTLSAASMIENLTLSDVIDNRGTLTISGISLWDNGQFIGGGDVINAGDLTVDRGLTRLVRDATFTNSELMSVDASIGFERASLVNTGTLTLSGQLSQRGTTVSTFTNRKTLKTTVAAAEVYLPFIDEGGTIEVTELNGVNPSSLTFNRAVHLQGSMLQVADEAGIVLQGNDDHTITGGVTTMGTGSVFFRNAVNVNGTLTNRLDGMKGLELTHNLKGTGSLDNHGRVTWTIGTLSLSGGVTNRAAGANDNDHFFLRGFPKHVQTTFTNEGSVVHDGGSLNLAAGSSFVNKQGAKYHMESGSLVAIFGDGVFTNQGEFLKSGNAALRVGAPFHLSTGGMVHVENGRLLLSGGGDSTAGGKFKVDAGADVVFDGGRHVFRLDYDASGEGGMEINNPATMVVGNDLQDGSTFIFNLTSEPGLTIAGNLEVNGLATNQGNATWNRATISGMGVFENLGQLKLDGLSSRTLTGRLRNGADGTVNQAKILDMQGGTVFNEGTWNITGGRIDNSSGEAVFHNLEKLVVGAQDASVSSQIDATLGLTEGAKVDILPNADLTLRGGGFFIGNSRFDVGKAEPSSRYSLSLTSRSGVIEYQVAGGTVNMAGMGNMQILQGATLDIAAGAKVIVALAGEGNLTGGTIQGSGSFVNASLFTWRRGRIALQAGPPGAMGGFQNLGFMGITTSGTPKTLTGLFVNGGAGEGSTVFQASTIGVESGHILNSASAGWFVRESSAILARDAQTSFVNDGQFLVDSIGGRNVASRVEVDFDNQGEVAAAVSSGSGSASVTFAGELRQYDSTTFMLTGGTWRAEMPGTRISFPGPIYITDPDTFLHGDTNTIGGLNELRTNRGELNLTGASKFLGDLVNEGRLINQSQDQKVEAPKIDNNEDADSATDQADGVHVPQGQGRGAPFELLNGFDVGDGQFTNRGTIRPGGPADPGAFPIQGQFVQTETGILETELAGTLVEAEYDRLFVNGPVTLDGTLAVSLLGGFAPEMGHEFAVVAALEGLDGGFSNTELPPLADGLDWSIRYEPDAVWLEVIQQMGVLPGDFNGNGAVEQADLDLVLLNWGNELADPLAVGWTDDLPAGPIDQAELDRALLNWGNTLGTPAATSVPEPSGLVLVICSLLVLLTGLYRSERRRIPTN